MKKHIALSAIVVGLLGSVNVQAAEDLSTMFSEGKTSGQIRTFYINRDDNTKAGNQIATAVGGHLKYETAAYKGLSLGAAFHTTNRILQGLEDDVMGPNTTLLKNDGSSYSILGEAFIQYNAKDLGTKTTFKMGRQMLNTPLAGADDARMIPNMFEAYVLTNSDISNTTVVAAHVTKFAAGTFANAYNGGIVGATGGYTSVAGNTAKYQGEFTNMGTWAVGKETAGVSTVGAIFKNDNFKVQLWDYYAYDILNAVYAQVDAKWKCLLSDSVKPFASVQFIKEDGMGSVASVKDIDSMYWGAKVGAGIGGFKAYVAYSQQSDAEAGKSLENSTITPWGGMPAFTQGMVTRHMFLAGTKATKVAATYSFKEHGVNLSATGYYASFDMDANSGYGTARTAKEPGFDVIYYPDVVKKLQLRVRGNFPTDFGDNRDWSEYRFIANYNF
ncbi:outer membrane porin [Sulfurimonas gotlandica GD1]|uniref:Outer membrane porin n=1 Tax=Sulfurimonas gotlandica (strain DSM 19862 / JCM 16533 / GD1) TaxID=929558 RepID=B6BKB9_SULGG|nr:OprD family outer membrane porin [Sulfurimonas gotlandica]EDZ62254.1 outer membrane porin, OprD family [Sulfurimonas gotlandica GD1]EHP28974.1 outer membrane porin [Sulfurimonas gotlandica GD1]